MKEKRNNLNDITGKQTTVGQLACTISQCGGRGKKKDCQKEKERQSVKRHNNQMHCRNLIGSGFKQTYCKRTFFR